MEQWKLFKIYSFLSYCLHTFARAFCIRFFYLFIFSAWKSHTGLYFRVKATQTSETRNVVAVVGVHADLLGKGGCHLYYNYQFSPLFLFKIKACDIRWYHANGLGLIGAIEVPYHKSTWNRQTTLAHPKCSSLTHDSWWFLHSRFNIVDIIFIKIFLYIFTYIIFSTT